VTDLADRVALVTGGTRGIGLATAQALAEAGARVVITGRDSATAKQVAESFGGIGIGLDVTDADEVGSTVRALAKEHGRLDIVVANAGILEAGMLGMIKADSVDRTLSTNVAGTLHTVQAAGRAMMRRKSGSIIVCGRDGQERLRYNFVNAWPMKWNPADYNATGKEVAIEEFTLAHEGLELA